jgi:nucleotide-binding universal stress UspA family protein
MNTITRILVPTDFSEAADQALTYALELGKAFGATVSLVHVFDDPFERTLYSEQYVPMPAEIRDEILTSVRQHLAERVSRAGRPDVSSTILTGLAAQAIVDHAREQKADLIVMGTHGRHGVAHLLMGSVAERVVRTAACPVLTVRGESPARGAKAA